jgi:glycosyltransferase involved in cell wall biosynthesis
MKKVSIITVVKNAVKTINETILSVINQDYSNIEFIIIDGVSKDGTLEIISQYSNKISKIISEKDLGIYDAMNKGIKIATGDWIYFLGADDLLSESNIITKIFNSKLLPNTKVIYGNVLFKQTNRIYDGEFNLEKMCNKSICHQSIFYNKEIFKEFGYFDIQYRTAADYYFNVKCFCQITSNWKYVDEIIAIYNENGISKVTDKKSLDDNFELRYMNFRNKVSTEVLLRVFWSSFYRYLKTHKLKNSIVYLNYIYSDIGILNLCRLTPLIFIKKIKEYAYSSKKNTTK